MSAAEKDNVIRILEYRSVEQFELTKPRGSHADVSASDGGRRGAAAVYGEV